MKRLVVIVRLLDENDEIESEQIVDLKKADAKTVLGVELVMLDSLKKIVEAKAALAGVTFPPGPPRS